MNQDETHVKTKMYFDGTDVKKGMVVYDCVFLVWQVQKLVIFKVATPKIHGI